MSAEKVWIVYKITGKCGRAYVGMTSMKLDYRWNSHLCAAEDGCAGPLYDLIREKSDAWFSLEVICECFSKREALTCEGAMIAAHDTYYRNGGLNRNTGGGGTAKGDHSEETRRRISSGLKRRYEDNPDSRFNFARIYAAMGRPVSEDGRAKKLAGLKTAHTPEVWAKSAQTRREKFENRDELEKKRRNEREWISYEKALADRVRAGRPYRYFPPRDEKKPLPTFSFHKVP